jgi:DNA-binding response OmpR family regulator
VRKLVAEDVKRLADGIAEGLQDQGMAVVIVYDSLDAAFKPANPYDAVVLDRGLFGLRGRTICRMFAASGQPVTVLMLAPPVPRATGLSQGADDHFPELVVRI